jgi:hypothetical protein
MNFGKTEEGRGLLPRKRVALRRVGDVLLWKVPVPESDSKIPEKSTRGFAEYNNFRRWMQSF